jgi:hypothetical protein
MPRASGHPVADETAFLREQQEEVFEWGRRLKGVTDT